MRAQRAGPGLVCGAVLAGVLWGERSGASSARPTLGLAVAGLAVALGCGVAGRRRAGLVGCCAAAVLGGQAVMARALDGQVHSPLAAAVVARADGVVDVTLTADPVATRFRAQALARVDRFRSSAGPAVGGGRTVMLDASGAAALRLAVLGAGDRVRLHGYLRPLDGLEARARWRHAVGAFAADDLTGLRPPASPLWRVAAQLRSRVLAGHARLPEPQRALVAGFLLGDTTDLPAAVVADFRAAGLSHLVAVSGQNVAVVVALAGPLLRRGPRGQRLLLGLVVICVFAAMTRFEPSVLRASAMAACSMTGLTLGRPTAGLRSLALAVIGLVLADPFLVHSVGFLLSCTASLGIAVLAPAVAARVPGPRAIAEAVGVTVGAQLAVAPILVAVFGTVPLVAVPANVVVAPVAGPLTLLGLAGGVIGGIAGGPLGAVAVFPAYVCASLVLVVGRWAATVPLAVGRADLALVLSSLAAGAVLFATRRARRATWRRARARGPEPRLAVPPR